MAEFIAFQFGALVLIVCGAYVLGERAGRRQRGLHGRSRWKAADPRDARARFERMHSP